MDKIFKQRFDKLEKKAPDHILDSILDKVAGAEISATTSKISSIKKIAIWAAASVVTGVALILLIPNNTNTEKTIISKLKTVENQSKTIKTDTKSEITNTSINTIDKHSKLAVNEQNANVITKQDRNKNTLPIDDKSKNTNIDRNLKSQFKIVAPRYTCNGECILEINSDASGVWTADKSVFIQSPNHSKTLIRYTEEEKVLFTYAHDGQQDTFTVFFKKPILLTYKISPEACGEENGKVEFDFPNSRVFVSTNSYSLNRNTFENLIQNSYLFNLEDNFTCAYSYKLNLPTEDLQANIKYEALDTRVDYPIYFLSNLEAQDVDFIWHFGDGELSYERNPSHQYKKSGVYSVELEIVKRNCSETIVLENLEIKDRTLEIPNIFTPNNDGKNDIFIVSVPESTKSFEGYILNKEGQLVYKWTDTTQGWDGLMMNGQKALSGSYYYVIKGVDSTEKTFEYKSYLELRR